VPFPHQIATLAQAAGRPRLVGRALALWIALTLVGVVLFLLLWSLSARRSRLKALGAGRSRRRRAIKDAWEEAGKRAEPVPPDDVFEADQEQEP
jgi:hypothetical protein